MQSFDEALTAGVPLVGIPMLADQWYNVERYASLKIGAGLLMEKLTEDLLANAINTVIDDPKYDILYGNCTVTLSITKCGIKDAVLQDFYVTQIG